MTKIAQLTMVVGLLAAPAESALAQMDRDYGRHDQYEALRTGPIEQRQGSVTFITGGVGSDEAAAFRASMSRYALGLEFARAGGPHGAFLADVHVSVINNRGSTVLQTIADGPFLLADLLTGTYTIHASFNGQVKTQTVTILPDLHWHLMFVW
ncbi:carboxypeptidase-like regulatory domain-containing protein [Vineibacter terrae]|uniref:carboxypeptidase-like regulatory domain-containing protein n=1 Tax=Vineibacter terrae TaxID=2586908 RepID=UPI002E31FE45|nr:carboxypeptidase-like regulatory domain-containing protein [Vineibacter terrae]HEX2889111.1 carboxypeptidase-like regulatory domain-containing protein [Vineibacter terrae]